MNIDIKNPAEWDFLHFIKSDKPPYQSLITNKEGRSALAHELCRDLYFTNKRFREFLQLAEDGSLEEQIKRQADKGHKARAAFIKSRTDSTKPFTDTSPFRSTFSVALDELQPWFELNKDDRERFADSYTNIVREYQRTQIPINCKMEIDVRWPKEVILEMVKERLEEYPEYSVSIGDDLNVEAVDPTDETVNFNWSEKYSQTGRGWSRYSDNLCTLGRYRILRTLKSPTAAIEHWSEYGFSKPMDRRSFNKKDLTQWHQEAMKELVDIDPFLKKYLANVK